MELRSHHHESVSLRADVERQRVPRVAVARRIDSKRPTRVWSLLLSPSFVLAAASSDEHSRSVRTAARR